MDIPNLEGKNPLLMSNIQVNFGDILPETSKSSVFWDMGVDSHLKWLPLFSPNEAGESGRLQSRPTVVIAATARWMESAKPSGEQTWCKVLVGIEIHMLGC